MVNNGKIGFGIFLVTIGIILILINFGIINSSIFISLLKLWPVILIIIGINTIFKRYDFVKYVTWLAFLAILIVHSYVFQGEPLFGKVLESNRVTIERPSEIKTANLSLDIGAARINVDSGQGALLDAEISAKDIRSSRSFSDNNQSADIRFARKSGTVTMSGLKNEQCFFHLNNDVLWNLDIDTGAAKGKLDMTDLKVGNLKIDSGASSFDLKFGDKSELTEVEISSGVSSYNISVPSNTGVKIRVEGALNSKNFSNLDLQKQGDYYISSGYDTAKSKISIDCSIALATISVTRY